MNFVFTPEVVPEAKHLPLTETENSLRNDNCSGEGLKMPDLEMRRQSEQEQVGDGGGVVVGEGVRGDGEKEKTAPQNPDA